MIGALLVITLIVDGFAVTGHGWVWPYPQILPHTFHFQGSEFSSGGCLKTREVHPGAVNPDNHIPLHPVGSLPSVLYFGSAKLYGYFNAPKFGVSDNALLWVFSAGCAHVYYSGNGP